MSCSLVELKYHALKEPYSDEMLGEWMKIEMDIDAFFDSLEKNPNGNRQGKRISKSERRLGTILENIFTMYMENETNLANLSFREADASIDEERTNNKLTVINIVKGIVRRSRENGLSIIITTKIHKIIFGNLFIEIYRILDGAETKTKNEYIFHGLFEIYRLKKKKENHFSIIQKLYQINLNEFVTHRETIREFTKEDEQNLLKILVIIERLSNSDGDPDCESKESVFIFSKLCLGFVYEIGSLIDEQLISMVNYIEFMSVHNLERNMGNILKFGNVKHIKYLFENYKTHVCLMPVHNTVLFLMNNINLYKIITEFGKNPDKFGWFFSNISKDEKSLKIYI